MHDCIVIGAGPGGIVCTKELIEHGAGRTPGRITLRDPHRIFMLAEGAGFGFLTGAQLRAYPTVPALRVMIGRLADRLSA